jgi:hypothetical protein
MVGNPGLEMFNFSFVFSGQQMNGARSVLRPRFF